MPTELLLVKIIKGLTEVAAFFMLGQGALYVLTGAKREQNFMYQIFSVLTRPVMRAARFITPKAVVDQHIPFAALMLLFWIWVACIFVMGRMCLGLDIPECRGSAG